MPTQQQNRLLIPLRWPIVLTPAQALASDLLANGDFEANITGWNAGASATLTNPAGTRTGGSGTKVLHIAYNGSNQPFSYKSPTIPVGAVRQISGWAIGDGTFAPLVRFPSSGVAIQTLLATAAWQPFDLVFTDSAANNSALLSSAATGAGFAEFDDVVEKIIIPKGQITTPAPNMRVTQFYTLAASPVVGSEIWVMPRISSFLNGNYWLVLLKYNTSGQWDITLFSVAGGTRTSRTSATNIGTTNGIRVNCNGNLFDLQTTVDDGATWTTRGSQVSNSLYNTATGVNVVYSPNNTIGVLTVDQAA